MFFLNKKKWLLDRTLEKECSFVSLVENIVGNYCISVLDLFTTTLYHLIKELCLEFVTTFNYKLNDKIFSLGYNKIGGRQSL